ncbi:MAG: pyrimidine 5'-nucleotidase [Anaerolineales bacterium]|nr:pyrimidine 5'-nucleotidase [Anaerolineales bacterium]
MQFSTLFFDLDATLYPASNGLWEQIRLRIYKFMLEEIGIPEAEIPATRDKYWTTYGTTLEGLRIHHQVEPDDYLKFVHDLPLKDFLEPDPVLRGLLETLPQDLWVFTNADHHHASRVLTELGISDLFSGIVDLLALDFIVKPNRKAYQVALKLAGVTDPKKCVMFDDLIQNLIPAKELGFYTSLVGENGSSNQADIQLQSIHDMKEKMPQLWSRD